MRYEIEVTDPVLHAELIKHIEQYYKQANNQRNQARTRAAQMQAAEDRQAACTRAMGSSTKRWELGNREKLETTK